MAGALASGLALSFAGSARAFETPIITFAINVHDWRHLDESADTVLRLVAMFRRYGVRGDFYLTPTMAEEYADRRPDVIAALNETGQTISYHVRAPHPMWAGFDGPIAGLSGEALTTALLEYETYRLDLRTGELDRSRPGGFTYMTALFGRPPSTVGTPSDKQAVRAAAKRLLRELGAQAIVIYHEEGTAIDRPFEWDSGLLIRPSDFSVTRWSNARVTNQFWWNMLSRQDAADFEPLPYLQRRLAAWSATRPPIITSLIHENNFVRRGAESWTLIYFADRDRTRPLSPPYDLDAPDPSQVRSASEQARIWAAYEELVAWSAAHLRVLTSEDLVALASGRRWVPITGG
ncbi:MAG: hypothetical protein KatS3mg060_2712 [Dehalococcoidia bacterium]|nr:MAG: hypothetical protein KatS3mg060_2712 [Dehalococcoidia bacterium]